MKRTVFVFGRTPTLAYTELTALYPTATLLTSDIASVSEDVNAPELIHRLGGTVKIAVEVGRHERVTEEIILSALMPHVTEGKIAFGISVYGSVGISQSVSAAVKQSLVSQGIRVRYVEAKHESALGSVVIEKQNLVEVIVIAIPGTFIVAVTQAVQDFEAWNKRDSARPMVDPHRGMLPPKVARMIVNIALQPGSKTTKTKQTLLDPFCGVGTVLSEAMLSNCDIIGVDISPGTVARAQKNIAWLKAEYGLLTKKDANILVGDATHVSELLKGASVDAIATEPFMGAQMHTKEGETLSPDRVKNILKGLEKLYIGCLKDWFHVLSPGGRIVMAMPQYMINGRIVTVKNVVDRCESLGYTLLTGPIEYSRPQAQVRREFYVFVKN